MKAIVVSVSIVLALLIIIVAVTKMMHYGVDVELSSKCRAEIGHIHNALLEHKMEYGEYPTISGADATALESTPVTNWMPRGTDFVDPWYTPYYLEFTPNNTNGKVYVLFSFGPDKKQGTRDDVEEY